MNVINESIACCVKHLRKGDLNWPMIIFLSLAHIAGIYGIFTIPYCHKYTLLWAYILWPISGWGITAGVHRLWAHRSYKASFGLRVVLMLANSIANQGCIYHWSRDHRVHHKHSDVSTPAFPSRTACYGLRVHPPCTFFAPLRPNF